MSFSQHFQPSSPAVIWTWTSIGALVLLMGCQVNQQPSQAQKPADPLALAIGSWRPHEIRLHPQWQHHSWHRETSAAERKRRRADLVALEVLLNNEFARDPSWQTRWNLVWLNLAWGQGAKALALLAEASPPPDQRDVTRYARAVGHFLVAQHGDARSRFLALANIDAALVLKPDWAPALFNRALILESLFLDEEAVKAWQAVLHLEPDPGWHAEAGQRLAALMATQERAKAEPRDLATVVANRNAARLREWLQQDQQSLREALERDLLPKWAESLRVDPARASLVLQDLAWACNALPASGHFLIRDVVDHLENLNPQQQIPLAEGHAALAAGVKALKAFDFEKADSHLKNAAPMLDQWGHPGKFWLAYAQAELLFYRGQRLEAKQNLRALAGELPDARYPSLQGRTQWMLGLICQFQGLPLQAGGHFDQARIWFEQANDQSHLAGIFSLLGENERFLGQDSEAFSRLLSARELLASYPDARRGYAMAMFSNRLISDHLPALSPYFLAEAQRFADALGHPQSQVYTHLLAANAWLERDQPDQALVHIHLGQGLVPKDPAPQWLAMLAQLQLAEAEASMTMNPQRAAAALDTAERWILEGKRDVLKEPFYRLRANYYLWQGMNAEAEADLVQGIRIAEDLRADMADASQGQAFLQQARAVFEDMVRFQLEGNAVEKAWAYAQRFQASSMRFAFNAPSPPLPQFQEVQAHLPANATLLCFWVQKSQVGVWVIQREALEFFRLHVTAEVLRSWVDAFHSRVATSRDPGISADQLSQVVLAPLASKLAPGIQLLIVPDGALHGLPFSALRHPLTNRYLIEEMTLATIPSTLHALAALKTTVPAPGRIKSALVVGDPRFDQQVFSRIPSLPGSLQEARAVAGVVPQAALWVKEAATGDRILAGAGNYDLFHFGGHALTGASLPGFDHLLVAASGENPGVLYAHQLAKTSWGKLSLVTLAACGTNSGAALERPNALVAALLEAGVPAVLAHAWNVDDAHSQELLLAFYRRLMDGQTPAAALRMAQVEAIRAGRDLRHWAGYQVHGAWVDLAAPH